MTTLEHTDICALNMVNTTTDQIIDAMLAPGARRTAAFVNAHCLNVAARDPIYRWALARADFRLPDGSGMQLAAKLRGTRFVENLNGTDLFVPLCKAAAARDLPIYFLGSAEGVAREAADKAREIAPGLTVAGARNGFFSAAEEEAVIKAINATGARIVLVAMGVPKQDIWIARNRHRLNADLVMGVGAQFDFWSGRVPRAPAFVRRAGLEWVVRLAVEPRRMANRYLIGNFEFTLGALFGRRVPHLPEDVGMQGKRLLDFALSSLALLGLSPLFALIAAAIALESPGPVLFRQIRVGQDGKTFTIFKFRSMYRDAEARRAALLAKSDRPGICFKAKDDPRVTKVGKILRRFSLDELPQLLNIWLGDMAIVGPRPALPQEVAAYPVEALRRLKAKPGLTGLWQVGGRAEIGFDKMVEMDTAHVGARSIFLDIIIIALTARAVIGGRGAY
jgi:exopolysaccharide biosynthesis WecB/TagA/CpsF family protein